MNGAATQEVPRNEAARKPNPQAKEATLSQEKDGKAKNGYLPEDFYLVEKLIKHKKTRNGIRFLVKWLNYDENQNTWEPTENIPKEIIEEYWRSKARK